MDDRERYPFLAASHEYSQRILKELRSACFASRAVLSPLSIIAAAGSVGRLEAAPGSDLDSILVRACSEFGSGSESESAALDWIWQAVESVGLRAPKNDGIFRRSIARCALLAPDDVGRLDESPAIFGKRIQILLDSRAIFGEAEFAALRSDVLDWYLQPECRFRLPGPWHYLVSDLLRYANAYGNWQSTKLTRSTNDSWALRQVKLRSTRFVTWAGLWLMILRAREIPGEGIDWVRANLHLTPIERIRLVIEPEAPHLMDELLEGYEIVHAHLTSPERRARLVACGLPDGAADPVVSAEFAGLMSHCKLIRTAVARYAATKLGGANELHVQMAVPF